jgi:hypothetical protein
MFNDTDFRCQCYKNTAVSYQFIMTQYNTAILGLIMLYNIGCTNTVVIYYHSTVIYCQPAVLYYHFRFIYVS